MSNTGGAPPGNTAWIGQDQAFLANLGAGQRSVTNIGVGASSQVADAVGPDPTVSAFPMVNTFSVGGQTLPGKWTLHKCEREFGWQIKQSYGLTGAFVVPKGDPPLVALFRGEFWRQSDYLIYKQLREKLFSKICITAPGTQGGTTYAMGINHPEVNGLGCYGIVCLKHGAAIDMGGGLWEVRVDFMEFRNYIPALTQPTQKIPAQKKAPPIAQNATQAENIGLAASLESRLRP